MTVIAEKLQTTVSLKNHLGNLASGDVDWINEQKLQVRVDTFLEAGMPCEARVELRGLPVSVYIHGKVLYLLDTEEDEVACAVIEIDHMPERDLDNLQRWLLEGTSGGTSVDPASWVGELSGIQGRKRGRSSVRAGLREGLGMETKD
jgi:hypothetical protein